MAQTEAIAVDTAEGLEVLEEAYMLYRDAGLRLPPVPRALAPELEQYGDSRFGTVPADLTDRDGFLAAALDPASPDEVGFGLVGHGVVSWHLCYRLVLDPLAVFVRQIHGGARLDADGDAPDESARLVNDTAAALEDLVAIAITARADGRLTPGERLVVVLDDREGDLWRIGPTGEKRDGEHVLADAIAFLQAA